MRNRKGIMVCGHYACGKTSLIQTICKEGLVPNEAIHPQSIEEESRIGLYETEAVDFVDGQGMQFGELAYDHWQIVEKIEQDHCPAPADCIWYCIDGAKTSLQEGDKDMIDLCGENMIVVVTRSDLMTEEMIQKLFIDLSKNFFPDQIVITSSKKKLGLNKLLEISKRIVYGDFTDEMPIKWDKYCQWDKYFAHQEDWVENAKKSAEKCILNGAAKAFAISKNPPVNDRREFLISLLNNRLYMYNKIGACYGCAADPYSLLFSLKTVPGNSIDDFSLGADLSLSSSINTATTYAAGCTAKAFFESDMTLKVKELNKIFASVKEKGEKIDWKNQPMGE